MRFKINAIKLILFVHVGLGIFDLRFLILPWIYIGFYLWALATKPLGGQWVPADMDKIKKMLKMAAIKPGETLYDLGSGDGRIVAEAAKTYKTKSFGVEIDPIRVLISRLLLRFKKLHEYAKIYQDNLFKVNLKDADVVTMYLLPWTINRLKPKFKKELKQGSRIVSLKFPIENWKPVKVDSKNEIFVYRI